MAPAALAGANFFFFRERTLETGTQIIKRLPHHIQQKIPEASLPVQYEAAVRTYTTEIAKVVSILDGKRWADAADAIAVWAKINRDERVAAESKKMKKHALVKIADLARATFGDGSNKKGMPGCVPGAHSALVNHGVRKHDAAAALSIARAPEKEKQRALNSDKTLLGAAAPFAGYGRAKASSEAYRTLFPSGGNSMYRTLALVKRLDPVVLARGMTPSEAKKARRFALELIEWFDTFEQALPK